MIAPSGQEPSPAKGLNPMGDVARPPQASAESAMISDSATTTINVLRRALRAFILVTSCSFVCGHAILTHDEAFGFTH